MRMRIQNTCYNAILLWHCIICSFLHSNSCLTFSVLFPTSCFLSAPLIIFLLIHRLVVSLVFNTCNITCVLNVHAHRAWSLHIKASGFTHTWSQGQMTVVLATVGMAKARPNYSSIKLTILHTISSTLMGRKGSAALTKLPSFVSWKMLNDAA